MKRTKRVLGLALAAVMCMGMLAGCGGTKNATNGTETSEKVLNIATIGETTTLSPLYMIADNRPTQKLLYEGLVKYAITIVGKTPEHHHAHFVCKKCHTVSCLDAFTFKVPNLPSGYQTEDSDLLIKGVCKMCTI